MKPKALEFRQLLDRAREGDRDAVGELLQQHRPYLKFLTQRMMGERLGGRLDASDVIQQTCLSVFGNLNVLDDVGPDEFAAWLRTVHERNVKNVLRTHVGTQKRSLQREQTWETTEEGEPDLSARQSSPSQRLMQGERAVRLAAALQELPADQRQAVRLRYLEGWALPEIAEQMQRTKFSVAGLLKRGLAQLRVVLARESRA